jgi:hypothetical protein
MLTCKKKTPMGRYSYFTVLAFLSERIWCAIWISYGTDAFSKCVLKLHSTWHGFKNGVFIINHQGHSTHNPNTEGL